MDTFAFDETTHKIQYSLYGINGELYKQGFACSYRRMNLARNRHSKNYGGGLTLSYMIVPKTQKSFTSVISVC
jgi:hypothetical protein